MRHEHAGPARKKGHIALVTLNCPEARNSFSPEMLVRLADHWEEVRDDAKIRVGRNELLSEISQNAGFNLLPEFLPQAPGGGRTAAYARRLDI